MGKWINALGLAALSSLALLAEPVSADAAVFLYHRFGEDRHTSTNVRLEQFEAHLEYLDRNGFTVWPLDRVVAYHREGRDIPDRTAAITVDDAYLSVYTEAFPRLKARGWPFTVFVSTQAVDQRLAGFMSWEQMREMGRDGASFGNHGVTHDYLVRRKTGETDSRWRERMQWELDRAQQRLSEELGVEEKLFAYPYGEYDEPLAKLVRESGYIAFGQQSGPVGRYSDPRALPRFPMAEAFASIEQFANKAGSRALPVRQATPWNPIIANENPPRLELQLEKRLPRAKEMRCYVTGQEPAELQWLDTAYTRIAVRARAALAQGRSRYNCTVPGPQGRFYWYSHLWLVVKQ